MGDCAVVSANLFEGSLQPYRMSGTPHNLAHGGTLLAALEGKLDSVGGSLSADGDNAVLHAAPFEPDRFLQLTRALGDAAFKIPAATTGSKRRKLAPGGGGIGVPNMSAAPHVASDSSKDMAFVVLCSDGITDQLSDGDIVAVVAAHVAAGGDRASAAAAVHRKALQHAAFASMLPGGTVALEAVPPGEERRGIVDDLCTVVLFLR